MSTSATPTPRRSRGWVIALVVATAIIALLVAGELIARAVTPKVIADEVRQALELPAEHPVDVSVGGGMLLPQLVSRSIADVELSTDELTLGDVTVSHVTARADSVAFSGALVNAEVEASFTPDQVLALIPPDVIALDELSFAGDEATAHLAVPVLGTSIPLTLSARPGVAGGDLTLTPTRASMGNLELTAADLQGSIGGVAADLVKPWPVCLAESIPQGVRLTDVRITDGALTARATIADDIASDAALQAVGTCR